MWGFDTSQAHKETRDAFDEINKDSDAISLSITQQDIEFVFSTIAKEAPYDKQSIKQIFYGMMSAFTKVILHHAISSKNAGAGKTYLLVLVSGYIPKKYVVLLNGMSDKAILHKAGIMVVENEETGTLEPLDTVIGLLESQREVVEEEIETIPEENKEERKRLKKNLREIDSEIKSTKARAEKLIVLESKVILLLDTTQDGMFSALMSLVSQDTKEDQKYEYVDTNGTIGTRSNRIRGTPAIFTCQVVDDSRQARYAEKNRRFIHVIPNTSNEKIQTAINQMDLESGLIPEEYDSEVVSIENKSRAQEICSSLVEKLIEHSKHFGPKESGIKIFFPKSISQSISKEHNDVWAMTIEDRIRKYLAIITKAHMDSRPRVIDTVNPGKFYPVATFEDVKETLELMTTAASALRPYIVDWYDNVFLEAYNDLGGKAAELIDPDTGRAFIKEIYVGVNTKQLADKTTEIMGISKANSKDMLQQYLYPLLNLGIIDKVKSEIDRRGYIYYPIEEGNIHTLFSDPNDKRLEVFDSSFYPSKKYIEENSRTFVKYSSKGGGVADKKYRLVDPQGHDITVEELIDRYLNNPEIAFKESENNGTPPQARKNNLTEIQNNITEEL